jgi:cytochrome c556
MFPAILALASCGPPIMNTPIDAIPALKTLAEVMDNQATIADPQFKKAGESSYSDADWTAFTEMSTRLQATSKKTKDFTKGSGFDALADRLGEKAKALGDAAASKDVAKASATLGEIKATCKECHSTYK